MERNSNIASLFQKHAAKKSATASSPSPAALAETLADDQPQQEETVVEKIMDHISPPIPSVPLEVLFG